MKKRIISAVAILLASSMMFTSCIGSFGLTNKVRTWNQSISNKFVNELVFIGFWILPVYEISILSDMLVINSIEFWSGSNPVIAGKKTIKSENGEYLVEWNKSGYKITNTFDKTEVNFTFDSDTQTWSVATPEGDVPFLTFIDETHVKLPAANGEYKVVELSQAGVMAYKDFVGASNLAMR